MRYKIILICWYLYIIIFFFTKMGDWTAILCIVAPSTYNCSQPGGADLRSIRVILFYECSDYSLYILYLPLLLTNNLPLELRIHMYNYIDDYQIRSNVHHITSSVLMWKSSMIEFAKIKIKVLMISTYATSTIIHSWCTCTCSIPLFRKQTKFWGLYRVCNER